MDDTPAGSLQISHVTPMDSSYYHRSENLQLIYLVKLFSSCLIKLNLRGLLAFFYIQLNLNDGNYFCETFFLTYFVPNRMNLCIDSGEYRYKY